MAERGDVVEDDEADQKSHRGWRKMRARLGSNKDKPPKPLKNETNAQDVVDFLRSASVNDSQHSRTRAQPKIDVSAAQRYSGANVAGLELGDDLDLEEKWRPTKPRRREGLRVDFVEYAPEIIGEGGDDAETPAVAVSSAGPRNGTPPVLPKAPPVLSLDYSKESISQGLGFSPVEQVSSVSSMSSQEHQSPIRPTVASFGNDQTISQASFAQRALQQDNDGAQDPPRRPFRRTPTGFAELQNSPESSLSTEPQQSFPDRPSNPTVLLSSPADSIPAPVPNFNSEDTSYTPPQDDRRLFRPDSSPYRGLQRMREDEGKAFLVGLRRTSTSPASNEESRPQSSNSQMQLAPSPSQVGSSSQPAQPSTILEPSRSNFPKHQQSTSPPYSETRFPHNSNMSYSQPQSDHRPSSSHSNLPLYAPIPNPHTFQSNSHNGPLHGREPSTERGLSTSPQLQYQRPHGALSAERRPAGSTQYPDSPHSGAPSSERRPSASPQNSNIKATTRKPSPNEGQQHPVRGPPRAYDDLPKSIPEPQHPLEYRPAARRINSRPDTSRSQAMPGEDFISKDSAFTDFVERTSHMHNIFRLESESHGPSSGYSLVDWLRAALWWFLRGRDGIEKVFRSRPRADTGGRAASPVPDTRQLIQHHVNLTKAWWIITDVVDNAIDSEISEVKEIKTELVESLKKLCVAMARRNALPPPGMLAQGVDNSIWIQYPDLATEVIASLSETYAAPSSSPPSVLSTLPLGDSLKTFSYGRFFVQAALLRADEDFNEYPIQDSFPCVLSLLREAGDSQMMCVISSQSRLVYTSVRSQNTLGPSWDHVRWEMESQSVRVKLPRKLRMRLTFSKYDFDAFWGAYDYTQRVNATSKPRPDEVFLQRMAVSQVQYHDTMYPQSFPVEPARNCLVTLFERFQRPDEKSERKSHRFYRVSIATSPYDKLLRSVFLEVGKDFPVEYTYNQPGREHEMPIMQLFAKETGRNQFLSMTFNEYEHRDAVRDYLTGRLVNPDETEVTHTPGVSLSFLPEPTSSTASIPTAPIKFEWNGLQVINKVLTDDHQQQRLSVVHSEYLRVLLTGRNGSLVDHINVGPGELAIRISSDNSPSLSVLRGPREDAIFAMGPQAANPEHLQTLQQAHSITSTTRHILTYSLPTHNALHDFQAAVTGYVVLFDGFAANFAISRRRMVVPIYRKFDTDRARIQIVRQEADGHGSQPIIQMLAFFEDYSLADALNFQLKSTDSYELSEAGGKSGLWGVKLVDAKFALPDKDKDREKQKDRQGEEEEGRPAKRRSRFVTLDTLEYPSEHEDITVGFETEADRDRFADALPAAPQAGKKFTLKRRI